MCEDERREKKSGGEGRNVGDRNRTEERKGVRCFFVWFFLFVCFFLSPVFTVCGAKCVHINMTSFQAFPAVCGLLLPVSVCSWV